MHVMHARTDIIEVAALLVAARTIVADPARWCAWPHALDRRGRALISFEGGCRFCAAGAVSLAAHVLGIDDAARRRMSGTVDHVAQLLDCAACKIGDYESYIGLNEHDTHPRVVAMFDHALDMARAERPTRRPIDTELAP